MRWPVLHAATAVPAVAVVMVVGLSLLVVAHPGPLPGEVGYIRWLQARGEPLGAMAEGVRLTTSTEAALVVMIVPSVWLAVRHRARGVLAVAVALAVMLVVQPTAKELIDRPRPTPEHVEVRAEHTSKSFPSGHSMSTTTVWGSAVGLAWRRNRRGLAAVATVPIVVTFVASGVQGVHWPTDALAGTLFGLLGAGLVLSVLSTPRPVATPRT